MLIRHTLFYIPAKFAPGILGMMTTALLTRLLDPAEYGVYALIIVIMTLVSNIGFDWLSVSLLRFYAARRDDPRTIATFIHIFFVLMLVSAAGIAIFVSVFGGFVKGNMVIYPLGLVLAWCYSWFELLANYEIANFRPVRYLIMNLGRAVLMLLGASGAAWMTHDPIWTIVGGGGGLLFSSAFGGFKKQNFGLRYFNRDLAQQIFGFGWPLAMSLTLGGIIDGGTRALIAILDSSQALGLYTAAFLPVQNGLMVLASGISSASYQLAVRAVDSGDPVVERRQILDNGALLLAVLAPVSLGMALTADGIAHVLVGAKFQSTVAQLTPWMAAGAFFAGFRAYFLNYAFNLGDRPRLQALVTAVSAIVALGLSIYLIPHYGPLGAAIAVTLAMAFSCCLAVIAGHWAHVIPLPVDAALRVLCCCVFMAVLVLVMPGGGTLKFLAQVVVGALGYICSAFALNVLDLRTRSLSHILRRS